MGEFRKYSIPNEPCDLDEWHITCPLCGEKIPCFFTHDTDQYDGYVFGAEGQSKELVDHFVNETCTKLLNETLWKLIKEHQCKKNDVT